MAGKLNFEITFDYDLTNRVWMIAEMLDSSWNEALECVVRAGIKRVETDLWGEEYDGAKEVQGIEEG